MCGITGYIHFNKDKAADGTLLKAMTDCIAYRGPDGEGFYINDNIALGHRRLSIIDLSTGDQPMRSADGKKILIFNGEIYNYIELKEELKTLGHFFKTDSDTEVIIKSYEQWGYECQNKFNGMWAFALWDEVKESLFVSRDRLGEKPLNYAVYHDTFIFGSEIKSVLKFGVPKEIRTELIEIYLALTNIPAPDTFYNNIYKLMPGHYLIVKRGEVSEKKYWDFPQVDEKEMLTDKQTVYAAFATLLTDAVNIRMRSSVPFGAFLSGGLDSSAIVSLMAAQSPTPIKTFTIGFEDKNFDESDLAAEVAGKFKTEHYKSTVLPDDFEKMIDRIAFHYDEPFGDSSAIPTDVVSRFASQKVKMVLTGDGGDEALGGYTAYKGIKVSQTLQRYLPKFLRHLLTAALYALSKCVTGSWRYKLLKMHNSLKTIGLPFYSRMAQQTAFTDLSDIKILTRNIKNVIPVETYFEALLKKCSFKDDFYKLMYVHYMHSLPNDFLVKVDRMSMANSIETRLPFLDYRLVEFMARVHKNVKMPAWELKSVLRNSIGKNLPASVLKAPKRGFAIPLREWFKHTGFDTILDANLQKVNGILDRETVLKIVEENKKGKKDNGNFIWALLQLNKLL